MENITITMLCTIIGCVVGVLGYKRVSKKDTEEDIKKLVKMDVKLDTIGNNVNEIRLENKDFSKSINALGERVTIVEQSTKSAHHRIDDLEKLHLK